MKPINRWHINIVLRVICALVISICYGHAIEHKSMETVSPNASLIQFLRSYVEEKGQGTIPETRYLNTWVNLDNRGRQEAIVYLIGQYWCGSGGCNMLVLEPIGESYKIVTNATITDLPICVMETTSHGWHDLSVWVRQGGLRPGYQAKLQYDGNSYPTNPSVYPAQPIRDLAIGRIIIPDDASNAKPLYSESENPDPH